MADFVLTQTDAQVQSVLNDAQDAQGAGAQTTLTTEYVMLKDTNGRYHKILKSSLTEACRNVLASLLVNNDKGTTISQIAAIASGDFGSVTPANLASVLGETYNNAPSDFDNATGGIYLVSRSNQESYINCPVEPGPYGTFGILISWSASLSKLQVYIDTRSDNLLKKLWIRGYWNGTWTSWEYFTATTG